MLLFPSSTIESPNTNIAENCGDPTAPFGETTMKIMLISRRAGSMDGIFMFQVPVVFTLVMIYEMGLAHIKRVDI